jgi:hypothetical protein
VPIPFYCNYLSQNLLFLHCLSGAASGFAAREKYRRFAVTVPNPNHVMGD